MRRSSDEKGSLSQTLKDEASEDEGLRDEILPKNSQMAHRKHYLFI